MINIHQTHSGSGDNVAGNKIIYNLNSSRIQRHVDSDFLDNFNEKGNILDKTNPISLLVKANDKEVEIFANEIINFLKQNSWNVGNISTVGILGVVAPNFNGFYIMPNNTIIINSIN